MRRFKIPLGVKLFVAVWLAILCVPTARQIPRSVMFYADSQSDAFFGSRASLAELARQFPDAPIVLGWVAQQTPFYENPLAWRAVQQRFPADIELRALRLRQSAGLFSSLASARQNTDAARRAEWTDCAQVAHRGGQIEPDNIFWPWMETAFELAVGRDELAWRAFARVSQGTRFDDYQRQTLNSRLRWVQRHRRLAWEEKLRVSNSILFSHFSAMSSSAAAASARAAKLKSRGDARGALALEGALLDAARLWRRDSDSLIGALNSEKIARQSLEKFLNIPKPAEPGPSANGSYLWIDPKIHGAQLARAWAVYARENGRPELAANAAFVGQDSKSQGLQSYWQSLIFADYGMKEPWGTLAAMGPLLLFVLGVVIFAGALGWALSLTIIWHGAAPSRGQIAASANFSFWLLLGMGALILVRLGFLLNPFIGFDNGAHLAAWLLLDFCVLTLLCWLLPVWFLSWKRERQWTISRPDQPRALPPRWNQLRVIAWPVAALGALLIYSNGRGLWDNTIFQFSHALALAAVGLSAALGLELARWNLAGTRVRWAKTDAPKGRLRPWPLLLRMATLVGLALLFRGVIENANGFDQSIWIAFTLLAFLGALIVSWKTARDHFGWQLAWRTAGVLVLMWSLAFLALALGLWPLRAQLNRNQERHIRIGEMAWMREQVAKNR